MCPGAITCSISADKKSIYKILITKSSKWKRYSILKTLTCYSYSSLSLFTHPAHLLTYSFNQSHNHTFTHVFIHSLICLFIQYMHSIIYSFNHSFIQPFIHLFIHAFDHFFTHLSIHPFIFNPFIYLSIHLSIYSIHSILPFTIVNKLYSNFVQSP